MKIPSRIYPSWLHQFIRGMILIGGVSLAVASCGSVSGYGGSRAFKNAPFTKLKAPDADVTSARKFAKAPPENRPVVSESSLSGKQSQEAISENSTISFERPPSLRSLATGETKPPKPEEVGDKLAEAGEDWFFGPGLGRTIVNVGTVVLFPPYGLYLLGNAGLQLCGYDGLFVTDALPNKVREPVVDVYDGVTSIPGEVNSFVFNHQTRLALTNERDLTNE